MQIAPVQGHTDAAWRHFHSETYGGSHTYYTPFIRLERGEFRKHDLKDWLSDLNANHQVVPQVIFRDMEELTQLIEGLAERGAQRIDLNTGCPFPLQTARGRGAAFIGKREEYSKIPLLLSRYPEIKFSIKMRLGMVDKEEWRGIIDILNSLYLDHVSLHPRVAKQQYGGEVNYNEFEDFLKLSKNRVIYNGDLKTPEDIDNLRRRFPAVEEVMVGRGILARPSLFAEVEDGQEWSSEKRLATMMEFHDKLFDYYSGELNGDHQVLSKIKPFWEYAEEEIGRKAWKTIRKAASLAKYTTALASLR